MPELNAHGLAAIAAHKYKSAGLSKFETFVNPFWEACVTQVPMVNCAPHVWACVVYL